MYSHISLPKLSVLCATLALGGCVTLGPDYKAPELSGTEVPDQWTSPTHTGAVSVASASATKWWAELSDSALNRLVEEAFNNNPTLEAAVAKLHESRSQHAQARGSALPTVDAAGSRQRADSGDSAPETDSWLSMNSSWELDFFGAVRRGICFRHGGYLIG